MDFRGAQTKGSLYTREDYHRPTVHLKGVTHYTLQSKTCEKEYERSSVLLFLLRQVKLLYGSHPLRAYFYYKSCLLRAVPVALIQIMTMLHITK